MNIILFIDRLHSIAAGSERQIYKLAEGLVAAQHTVRCVILRHTEFTRTLHDFPCPIECLDIFSIGRLETIKTMLAFRARCKREKVDVIHAYFPDACVLAPLFLTSSHTRVITSRRDMGLIYQDQPAWLYRLLRHRTDKVIANSQAVADLITHTESLKENQCAVIYNGIEAFDDNTKSESLFNDSASLKLILVANIKPVKRTLDAVKATQQLIAQGHRIELVLAGEKQDNTYVAEIEQFISHHQLEKHIRLIGSVKEPRRILYQAHMGLLVSESEGLSNTIMEYMQAGLPVIATRVGGNPELVIDQVNGLLINKNHIDELAHAILQLADAKVRQAFGEKGAEMIQHTFSIDAMIQQHERVYKHKTYEHKRKVSQ